MTIKWLPIAALNVFFGPFLNMGRFTTSLQYPVFGIAFRDHRCTASYSVRRAAEKVKQHHRRQKKAVWDASLHWITSLELNFFYIGNSILMRRNIHKKNIVDTGF